MKYQHEILLESQAIFIYVNELYFLTRVKNFFGNPCEYTPSCGHRLVKTESDEQSYTLIVKDSGPGIKKINVGGFLTVFIKWMVIAII